MSDMPWWCDHQHIWCNHSFTISKSRDYNRRNLTVTIPGYKMVQSES